MKQENIEEVSTKYADQKGKGEFGLVKSAFKQGANWQKEQDKELIEELLKQLERIALRGGLQGHIAAEAINSYNFKTKK
jgi:hypothetical protein